MEKIIIDTRSIVNKKLIEKRKSNLNESFIQLRNIKNQDTYLEECFKTSMRLLGEGYTEKEVNQQLVKEFELPTSFGLDKLNNLDYKGMGKNIGLSWLKEMVIDHLLRFLGVPAGWATTLSQALADLNPLDLIRVFKDKASCSQHSKHIVDAVIEVSLRAGASKVLGNDRNNAGFTGQPASMLGNVFGEAIRQSNAGEKMGEILCNVIHK
jgi:hypothetical protein